VVEELGPWLVAVAGLVGRTAGDDRDLRAAYAPELVVAWWLVERDVLALTVEAEVFVVGDHKVEIVLRELDRFALIEYVQTNDIGEQPAGLHPVDD